MNALDNANIVDSPSNGLASFAFPKVKSTTTGESVEYAYDEKKKWYVLRIIHNQVRKIADAFIADGNYAYVAMIWKVERKNGKKSKLLVPFMNILFAYLSDDQAEYYVKEGVNSKYVTYYYDHFSIGKDGKNPPVVIKEQEIRMVILATSQLNEHVMSVDLNSCRFESNDMVEVTDGPFKGIIGRVARIARQKRVVITMGGVGSAITTAYIPPFCLKKLN